MSKEGGERTQTAVYINEYTMSRYDDDGFWTDGVDDVTEKSDGEISSDGGGGGGGVGLITETL